MLKKILFALALAGSVLVQTSANAVTFSEHFSTPPFANGWKVFGDTNLFQWNSASQNLEVTWDSSKPNSYFHRPLGTILAKDDDFSVAFDLRLSDITIGVNANKPFSFQITVGLLNLASATNANFIRGTALDSPNLVEFNYFPDSGFGATVSPTIFSSNYNVFPNAGFSVMEMTPDDLFHIEMNYTASNQTLRTVMTKNGEPFGPIDEVRLGASFSDFRVDSVSITSYSDAGQNPEYGEGSILAHGILDNFVITVPESPIGNLVGTFSGGSWIAQFNSRTNFTYVFERTTDFLTWTNVSEVIEGTGTVLVLQDANALAEKAFYRVRVDRP